MSAAPDKRRLDIPPGCPLGEEGCSVAGEVKALRKRLDELGELVRTDPLTGLANYRYFTEACEQEIERTQRSDQPSSLIMLDIDHFKRVNDNWGHEVGNRALEHIARIIKSCVRRLDIPCRYGGEEFAIILPDTSLNASLPVAERIRAQIASTPLSLPEGVLKLSASLGVATYTNQRSILPETLVREADHYLYQAKQNGRNRVCHAPLPIVDVVSQEERDVLSSLFGRAPEKEGKE